MDRIAISRRAIALLLLLRAVDFPVIILKFEIIISSRELLTDFNAEEVYFSVNQLLASFELSELDHEDARFRKSSLLWIFGKNI